LNTTDSNFRSGFVSIIGRPNVGKSTLLNKILGQKIAITTSKPQTTRNRILGIHNLDKGQILFLDTPGIHRGKGRLNRFMVDQAISACSDVDLILFLVEANDPLGGGDDFILDLISKGGSPVVLLINKIDLVPRPQLLALIDAYSKKFSFRAIIPISGLKGDGVDTLPGIILDLLPEGPRYYPEDMITDLPERFIVGEMIREQVLKQTRDEVPYGVAVTVESFEEKPEKNLIVIGAVIRVDREGWGDDSLHRQGGADRYRALARPPGFFGIIRQGGKELDRFGATAQGTRLPVISCRNSAEMEKST
jgi:GTP-binding protein Era